jgi:ribose transport system permease protein
VNSGVRLTRAIRWLLLVGLPVGFSIGVKHFLSLDNLYAVMQSFAFLGLLALGLSVTMIAGEFDLSVAAMATVAGLITIKLAVLGPVAAVLVAVVIGAIVGTASAALLPWLQTSSLVTTVGTMILLNGVGFWLAGGRVLSYDDFDVSDALDQTLLGVFSPRSLITIACFLLVALFLKFTTLGRDIYASGGHRRAAIQSGARVGLALVIAFAISGAFAALAGAMISLSLATASATLDSTVLLQAAAAAIVGGVALGGGIGTPGSVATGVLILTILNNGLGLLSANSTELLLVNGGLLLLVVLLDGRVGAKLVGLRRATP